MFKRIVDAITMTWTRMEMEIFAAFVKKGNGKPTWNADAHHGRVRMTAILFTALIILKKDIIP